jgi:RNA polymerase sigma factor (sigma-70 family)
MDPVADPLLKNLQAFVAFARKRVRDSYLAEDLVQESLLKALKADRKPFEEDDVISWFYRILRRSIIDLYRRQGARDRALGKLKAELPEQPDAQTERVLCRCFERLLPNLPAQYRELLKKIDLGGGSPKQAASQLGISANTLTVRLHRARKRLRADVERTCRACSNHGCLDCSCESMTHPA